MHVPPEVEAEVAAGERVLVACVGNDLVADDAVGCHVFDRLEAARPLDGVRVERLGLGGLGLLDRLRGEELLIVVDAVCFGAEPGTVHVLDWRNLPEARGLPVTSHDIDIREAISIGHALYPERMPRRTVLIGVEGRCFDEVGAGLSPEVEAALDEAVAEVLRQASGRP